MCIRDRSFPVFQPVSEQTVKQFHRDISTKTCELDRLPVSLLYHCLDALPPGITRVINDCLVWGVFPNCFKRSSNRPPSPLKAIPWWYLFEKLQTCLKFSFPVKNHWKDCSPRVAWPPQHEQPAGSISVSVQKLVTVQKPLYWKLLMTFSLFLTVETILFSLSLICLPYLIP